jgi:hypothetical protein
VTQATRWRKSSRSGNNGDCVEWRKSSRSSDNGACVEWRKSSRSTNNGDCVEARSHDGIMQVRDSKLGDDSPVFSVTGADFASLLTGLKRS